MLYDDQSAIAFSGAFYSALGYGYPVKTAFDLAIIRSDSRRSATARKYRNSLSDQEQTRRSHSKIELFVLDETPFVSETPPPCLWIHGWVKRVYDSLPTIELDWTRYFDRPSRNVPSQEVWGESLLTSLRQAKERLREYGDLIDVRGRLSLTAMLGVGFVFPRVDGYKLRAEQPTLGKMALWRSDAEPSKRKFQIIEEKQRRIGERVENILVVYQSLVTQSGRPRLYINKMKRSAR